MYNATFISDLHLGSKHCQADKLYDFLKNLKTKKLYLVGDILDGWRLKKKWYWPKSHNKVVKLILDMAKDIEVVYITGNHDEFLRTSMAKSVKINKLTIKNRCAYYGLDGKKYLVVHGDIFDYLMKFKFGRWIMQIGDLAYDFLMYINIYVNSFRRMFNLNYWSLTKYMKIKAKNATNWSLGKFLENFETQMTRYCSRKGYDGIICGHIHNPTINIHSGIVYMNDGDWVDNCSALVEDSSGNWSIIYYDEE